MTILRILFTCILSFFFSVSLLFSQDKISIDAKAFGTLPEITNVRISPDGTKLLMMQNYQGKKILVTRSLTDPNAKANGIPPMDNQEFNWASWASNDRIIAGIRFADNVNYAEVSDSVYNIETIETRLVSMDWDGENLINPIPDNTNRIRQSQLQDRIVDILENDPDHVLIQLDIDEITEADVYELNIKKRSKLKRVARGRGLIDRWRTDKNGIVRFGAGQSTRRGSNELRTIAYYRTDEDSGWNTLYEYDAAKEEPPFYFQGFTANPSIIYITKNDENGRRAGYTYNAGTKKIIDKIASHEKYDINSLGIDNEDNLLVYTYYDEQQLKLEYVNQERQEEIELLRKTFPNSSINYNDRSKDKQKVVFETASPTEPGTFYLFNKNKKSMEMLGYNYKEVDVNKLSEMETISYKARDGLTINGYLSVPKGLEAKNLPSIILPHGGPMARDSWGFDWWVQFLTAQGYAVLQMNYRGSTGYGEDFRNMGDQEWGRKMLEDINDGTKWMIEQGYADPNRICLSGGSYGGYAALQAIVKDPSLYKCSVAFAPVTDLNMYLNNARYNVNYKAIKNYIINDEWDTEEASPINNVDKINVPILLLHGDIDRRVEISHSKVFYDAMKRENKDIEYVEFKGGDHFFSKQIHRVEFLEKTGRFLAKNL